MDRSKRKTTSFQKETIPFTIKDTFNQNSVKGCGPHNVWVLRHTIFLFIILRGHFLQEEDIWENLLISLKMLPLR